MPLTDGPRPAWPPAVPDREAFTALVRERGAALYRDLPWRNLDDPYAVLVSEIMLQQTQVARVGRFWERFMALFPTIDALASADTSDVLAQWQGLGYNRRALALKRTADLCAAERGGQLPCTAEELVQLPGIGPATAAGVVAFAFDRPSLYLETNVRTVFLHELFPNREGVRDRELAPLVADTCPEEGARAWYYALLDYGAPSRGRDGRSAPSSCASCWLLRASPCRSWPSAWTPSSRLPAAPAWMRTCSTASSPTWFPRASSAGRATCSSLRGRGGYGPRRLGATGPVFAIASVLVHVAASS